MRNYLFGILFIGLFSACSGPKAIFEYGEASDTAPVEIKFNNTSEKAESYIWDFGDGTTSEETDPTHRYYASGNFLVTLKAKKGNKVNSNEQRVKIDAPQACLIRIETSHGEMIAQLYDETPQHRDNFIKLADSGFYNDLLFHRVIEGFMVQGGDPQSRGADKSAHLGSGGPGYQIPAEFNKDFVHVKGALSAARQGDQVNPEKKSSGSQFYIVQGREVNEQALSQMEARSGVNYSKENKEKYALNGGTPFLDNQYTVFGQVIEGLDVIDKIAGQKCDRGDRPVEDIWMKISVIK